MHICIRKLNKVKIVAIACNIWGKGRIEMRLTNVKSMIIQYLCTFLGVICKVVHGDPLRLACKQNLPCQKASKFCLTADQIEK